MRCILRLFLGFAVGAAAPAAEPALPPRPANAIVGKEFAARIASLGLVAREEAVLAEVRRGNVPPSWRRFVKVIVPGGSFHAAPDYLAVGSDEDYFLVPLSPATAQVIASELGCVLPTRKMVDAIYRAAPLKLEPRPIPPSPAMTTVAVMAEHNAIIRQQCAAAPRSHPVGTLVAGHKKDVVLTPRLGALPQRVAIYGWHRGEGSPIQPLYLGHDASWVDYSHGVRLVWREMTAGGATRTVDEALADDMLWPLLSDEGPVREPRYGKIQPVVPEYAGEKMEALFFEPGVRVLLNSPVSPVAGSPAHLLLYALPAGNTIEQTLGRSVRPGDDWHFGIQHIGAQTRWLRAHAGKANLIVAYVECAEKSWLAWRRSHPDGDQMIARLVAELRVLCKPVQTALFSHSAGGALVFGYLDAVESIPADIGRIAFLDSNYAYAPANGHAAKLVGWLASGDDHHLCVLAYEDHVALLDGRKFVSDAGGTWGRSHAMLWDMEEFFVFVRADRGVLHRHAALGGRIVFQLRENPEQSVWHTRQVELNGFIHAMLTGTALEERDYTYLGERVYDEFITAR